MRLRLYNHNDRIPRPVKFKRVVAPVIDALNLEYVKDQLVIDDDADDPAVQTLITAATGMCETYTNRALITQTRSIFYNFFPSSNQIALRYGPIQSITHLKIHLEDGTSRIVTPSDYYLTNEETSGALTLNRNKYWPTNILRPREGIEIEYICGYGDDVEDIPAELSIGMINLIQWQYQKDSEDALPENVTKFWDGYKLDYSDEVK